ncbi:hypothetical protein BDB00DRAFT_632828 [Zychaea mexicana]|uniref:uncharacterized protein n=1 Tax=Zychaea mexicana TaxID=64656 RepID=UPI0022FE685B|nr:uncharacterized protein BDB00DRAFT_632828 [Zychaea mexicana]KAI9489222.1 hypothetical protein BDB00DRAFT_632828 [Zychaea mexicana]
MDRQNSSNDISDINRAFLLCKQPSVHKSRTSKDVCIAHVSLSLLIEIVHSLADYYRCINQTIISYDLIQASSFSSYNSYNEPPSRSSVRLTCSEGKRHKTKVRRRQRPAPIINWDVGVYYVFLGEIIKARTDVLRAMSLCRASKSKRRSAEGWLLIMICEQSIVKLAMPLLLLPICV